MNRPWVDSALNRLVSAHQQERLPHALLLVGSEGMGKSELADRLAGFLLCNQPEGNSACGRCKECNLRQAGHHPDLLALEVPKDKKTISVDQVRQLVARLSETSHQAGWRIARISDVAAMNISAFNALLKTLEEPGENTLLMLQVDDVSRVPATIRSRCQLVNLQASTDYIEQLTAELSLSEAEKARLTALVEEQPGLLNDYVNGWLEQHAEFVRGFTQVGLGKINPLELAIEEFPDSQQLHWWFTCLKLLLVTAQGGQRTSTLPEDIEPAFLKLAKRASGEVIFEQLQQVQELTRTLQTSLGLNLTLQFERLWLHWFEMASKMSHIR